MSQNRFGRALAARPDHWDILYISLDRLPVSLMAAVLLCDAAFWAAGFATAVPAAEWLLGGVLVAGILAAANGLFVFLSLGRIRPSRDCMLHTGGNLLVLLLSLANLLLRVDQGAGAVVPAGIALSVTSLLLMMATARLARGMARRRGPDDSVRFNLF
jgi:uncharacterized membrane protein